MSYKQSVNPAYDLLMEHHFYVEWFSGTGKGGQHRNKHQNSCRLYHTPTGLVETRQGRHRQANLDDAKQALLKRLEDAKKGEAYHEAAKDRKGQVGSGMRGDKRRTYRFQDDTVADHETNRSGSCSKVMRGNFDILWR